MRPTSPLEAALRPGPSPLSLAGLSAALDRHRGARLAALVLLIVVAFAFQGRRPLYDPDEGRYVATGLQVLAGGDWLIPHLQRGVPHVTKPPLTTWALAVALALGGRTELAVRFPSALALVITVLATLGIARRFEPERAWLAAAVQATMLLPLAAANIVTPDPLLAAGVALSSYGFAVAWRAGTVSSARLGCLIGWSALGIAFLTKGPPALVPLLGWATFALVRGGRRGLGRLVWPPALLAFVVLGLHWYVAACVRLPGLFSYFVGDELVGRVASRMHGRNSGWWGAPVVYLPTLLAGTLPWTGVLLARLARPRRAWAALRERARTDESAVLLACWLGVPLAIFCLARSRLPLYLLPLFPALALLTARLVSSRLRHARFGGLVLAVWTLVALLPRAFPGVVPYRQDARALATAIERVAGGPLDEIVFVDMRPRYGLAFYLDAEVERVEVGVDPEPTWDGSPYGSLTDELGEEPGLHRLFAARTRRLGAVEAALAGTGVALRAASTELELTLFWLEPGSPASR